MSELCLEHPKNKVSLDLTHYICASEGDLTHYYICASEGGLSAAIEKKVKA